MMNPIYTDKSNHVLNIYSTLFTKMVAETNKT